MELISRECIFYTINNEEAMPDINSIKINMFEEIKVNNLNGNINLIEFTWLDTIKFKDKVIAKNRKNIFFLVFIKERIICFFSNSESDIYFSISKINKLFLLNLERVNTFNKLQINFENKNCLVGRLSSIEYKTVINHYEEITLLTELVNFRIKKLISQNRVTSFNYVFDSIYFSIDCENVMSFSDTDTFVEVMNVLEKFVEILKGNK